MSSIRATPVKLYSFHVLLVLIFLTLPDARRLVNFFVLNRSVAPAPETALSDSRHLNDVVSVAQLMLGGILACSYLYRTHDFEKRMASRPPFYRMWMVDEFTFVGKVLPRLWTESRRQRVVFQFPQKVGVQSMNGSWMGYWLHGDMVKKTFVMEKPNDPKKEFEFTFSHPDSRSLNLDRSGRGDQIRVKLHRLDEKQFVLLSRGIHWIDEDAGLVMEEESVCDRVKRRGGTLLPR